jgi:hypothetical protein
MGILHGADLAAGAAKAGRRGQHAGPFEAFHLGRQDFADGTGIDMAVGMTADAHVYRAVVQAGAAADAQKGLAQLRVGQDLGTAVVQDHQMNLFGAILLTVLRGDVIMLT